MSRVTTRHPAVSVHRKASQTAVLAGPGDKSGGAARRVDSDPSILQPELVAAAICPWVGEELRRLAGRGLCGDVVHVNSEQDWGGNTNSP